MDGWKTILSYWVLVTFQGRFLLNFGRVYPKYQIPQTYKYHLGILWWWYQNFRYINSPLTGIPLYTYHIIPTSLQCPPPKNSAFRQGICFHIIHTPGGERLSIDFFKTSRSRSTFTSPVTTICIDAKVHALHGP